MNDMVIIIAFLLQAIAFSEVILCILFDINKKYARIFMLHGILISLLAMWLTVVA